MKGVSGVFFAYIGFDAISTTAEECQSPQQDLPRGMIYSLIICTVLYVLIALVLTGMVSYKNLAVGDPLAYVFTKVGLTKISGIISFSAVIATASVLLIFQLGQPRIWMSMSRDGLLPKIFSRIHPKYHTPSFATVVTGFVVGNACIVPESYCGDRLNQYRNIICLCTGLRRSIIAAPGSSPEWQVPFTLYQFKMDCTRGIYSRGGFFQEEHCQPFSCGKCATSSFHFSCSLFYRRCYQLLPLLKTCP